MNPTQKVSVTDSDLDYPKTDSEQGSQKSSNLVTDSETVLPNSVKRVNSVHLDANEQFSQNSSTTDDLEMIDIDSLFDEDTDDRPVLSEEEAWELFA